MNLEIAAERVTEVLLANGWNKVANFTLCAFEFTQAGGRESESIPGASWTEANGTARVSCPLTSILAVKEGSGGF